VIFFSSTSSSANFFEYFSQFSPVADGMVAVVRGQEKARGRMEASVVEESTIEMAQIQTSEDGIR
jgi:hypothetical protein